MLNELVSAMAIAATLLTPALPSASSTEGVAPTGDTATTASVTTTIPLVRESLGAWYTLPVYQECPPSHPYVHTDEWVGSLPEHVTFLTILGGEEGRPAVSLIGSLTNWNFSVQQVPLDLTCTSDPDLAPKVPYSGP